MVRFLQDSVKQCLSLVFKVFENICTFLMCLKIFDYIERPARYKCYCLNFYNSQKNDAYSILLPDIST